MKVCSNRMPDAKRYSPYKFKKIYPTKSYKSTKLHMSLI